MKKNLVLLIGILIFSSLFGQTYLQNRVNVKFKSKPTSREIDSLCGKLNLEKRSEIPELNVVVFRVKSGVSVKDVIRQLKSFDFVEYGEPEYIYRTEGQESSAETETGETGGTGQTASRKILRGDSIRYVPGEVLVKFRDMKRAEQMNVIFQRVGLQTIKQIKEIGVQRCKIVTGISLEQMLDTLRANPDIEYAEPNYIYHALEIPNDPDFGKLWGMNNEGQTGGTFDADIDAPEAWEKEKGKKDIIVSIIDTGIDYNHPDLAANMWKNSAEIPGNGIDDDQNGYVDDYLGWDFVNQDNDPIDDNDHGTHCAGTVGAVGNNRKGVVGVNWQVSLMPLKFLNADGSGSSSDAAQAIIYAANMGAQIMSNSWGGGGSSQTLKDAIEYANSKGALFIAAAGNESNDNDAKPHYPSSYDVENVIAVAATDDRDLLADFSNFGATSVDLAAPGVDVYSTVTGKRYDYFSGTSMATPHVAGAAALVWAHFLPRSDKNMVKYRLFGGVDYVRKLENWLLLDGRLNVNNALSGHPLLAVVEKPANTNDETGPYLVKSSIVDDDSIIDAKLFYRINTNPVQSDTLELQPIGGYLYTAGIPGTKKGNVVEYKLAAADSSGNITETRFYSFQVGKSANTGCCGSFAATVEQDGKPVSSAGTTLLLNLLIFFAPPVLFKWKLRRRA